MKPIGNSTNLFLTCPPINQCVLIFLPHHVTMRKGMQWLSNLVLPYTLREYRYAYGNQVGTVSFVWKVTETEDESLFARVLVEVTRQLQSYFTREMKRQFVLKYSHITRPSKAVLRQMYRELVHDSSSARTSNEAEVEERVARALLDANETDLIPDLRKLNGKPNSSTFDTFWEEVAIYLDEINPAVDDRRHGEVCHMPVAISIRHLRDLISTRLKQKFPNTEFVIPSEEWVRLQFWPRNPYSNSALHYTGCQILCAG